MKASVVLFVLMQLISAASYATQDALSLTYHPNIGDYTVKAFIGKNHKKRINLMVDTGSSNLNVIGDKRHCPDCQAITAYEPYTPTQHVKHLDGKSFNMHYGKGGGRLSQFKGAVSLTGEKWVGDHTFGIYRSGKDVSNILGLAFTKASAPREAKLQTLFSTLNKKYDYDNQFSLLLCGNRAASTLFLGPLKNKHKGVTLPVVNKSLYFVEHTGISDKNNRALLTVPKDETAILDSGTSGKLVYPQSALSPLIAYLKKNANAKNRRLPNEFWRGTLCAPSEKVDVKAFPTLYFSFVDIEKKPVRLALPPTRYITSSSCGRGYYKLAFVGFNDHKNDSKTKHHHRNRPFPVILGTPFLEHFMTTFDKSSAATITLSPSQTLCEPTNKKLHNSL